MNKEEKQHILSKLPKVDLLLTEIEQQGTVPPDTPRSIKLEACRQAINAARQQVLSGNIEAGRHETVLSDTLRRINILQRPSLRPAINATGVIVHTNLGRSLLPESLIPALIEIACGYSNLEYNMEKGMRGSRYSHVEEILCGLTGAEAALVVNNNAAAVLICLDTLAKSREVVVSRGELVEIGGSFRIPDVMARSGAILREVGATNRTHLRDYRAAINENTAMLMKVHQSNFSVVGFTSAVPMSELSMLAREHGLYVFEDLGSGTLVDFSQYGLQHEPTVQESLTAGADIVSFSGDKLLGGPQAGIIVGKKEIIDRIKTNPMNRAMRIDKLTLVALEQVLRIYREPERAVRDIPTLRMMTDPLEKQRQRARRLAARLRKACPKYVEIRLCKTISRAGGGALPLQEIPSAGVSIGYSGEKMSAAAVEEQLRKQAPPLIVRVENNKIIMDVRTMRDRDFRPAVEAVKSALSAVYSRS